MAAKKKKSSPVLVIVFVVFISLVVVAIGGIFDKEKASKKHVTDEEMKKIYKLFDGYVEDGNGIDFSGAVPAADNQVAILLNGKLVNNRAIIDNGEIYLNYDFLKHEIEDKFYWDKYENVLLFTTPTDIIKAELGAQEYSVSKVKTPVDYQIVKTEGNNTYIAIDFIKIYADIEYSFYDNPNRIVLRNEWDVKVPVATLKKNVSIREKGSIKASIVYTCDENTEVEIMKEGDKWSKVLTGDGLFGYVKNSSLNKKTEKTFVSTFVKPEYTSINLGKTLSLGWHMTTSYAANNQLVDMVTPAKGMNVISPTWYRINDNEGNLLSLVDADYVTRAHMLGLDVWAMIDDQSSESDNGQIFPYTSKREKIINQLIADAINYGIDGINVDFEYISYENADDYIEFIRELSVKCRINGIVLSIDNKVPVGSNSYYNLKAQGEVADYVIIMGYDEHWGEGSGAGSVASLPWVTQGIDNTIKDVPASKVVIAVPFYTRVWEEDLSGNLTGCTTVSMSAAISQLTAHGIAPWWVDSVGQNYGEYTEGNTTTRIWLEDAQSIEEKLKLIPEKGLGGVGAWRLGFEDKDIWNTIIKYTN